MSEPVSENPLGVWRWFPPEEFAARRARIFDRIGGACALLQGAAPVRGFEAFRQTNELFYLSGVEIPQAYLLLDGGRRATTLFVPSRGAHDSSEGAVLGAEDADALRALTGIQAVAPLEALTGALAAGVPIIYTPHSPAEGRTACRDTLAHHARAVAADPWDGEPPREERFIARLRERVPGVEVRDLTPILDDLRLLKSPRELEVLRRAGYLSALAVTEAMRCTRPGVREYHLGAVADYLYKVNGARGEGYRAILPGGPNIWYSHYFRNDAVLRDGDLVLMDYAPEVCGYTSDIGRMWPVNGTYSPPQRELYGFVVRYHKALLQRLEPGALPRQVLAEAADEMRLLIDATAFSQPIYEQAARRMLDFQGHLSHPIGMAVHDVGRYFDRPMEPGLTFTVDPQMWVPEERLYVRVEDSVAITEDGVEILTRAAPLELQDVEATMRQEGLLQRYPPEFGA